MTENGENRTGTAADSTSRRVLPLALGIVLTGLCTIVSESLIPRSFPPQDPLGWLGLLFAIALFAVSFAITFMVTVYSEELTSSIRDRRKLSGQEKRERRPKIAAAVLLFTVTALAMALLLEPEKLIKDERIGGIDLAAYCQSYDFPGNDREFCFSDIDLDDACDWQYEKTGLRMRMEHGLYSGSCVDRKGEPAGGIKDMSAYCLHRFARSTDVEATAANAKTWMCRVAIDKDLACGWLYQKGGLAARQDGEEWSCYR